MAEFCQECSIKLFGEDFKDFANICNEDEWVSVLCEGCGWITVDWKGKRILDPFKERKFRKENEISI